jgi:hypothetical protein
MTGTQTLSLSEGYDTSPDDARVVEATRHLHDFRGGYAEALERIAEDSIGLMPAAAHQELEPLLRILGPERAHRFCERIDHLARAASGDEAFFAPSMDARITLRKVCQEAAHAVADEFHKDSCICREVGR